MTRLRELAAKVLLAAAAFIAGLIIGSVTGYDRGAADQAHLDALLSPEGRQHLQREFQKTVPPQRPP